MLEPGTRVSVDGVDVCAFATYKGDVLVSLGGDWRWVPQARVHAVVDAFLVQGESDEGVQVEAVEVTPGGAVETLADHEEEVDTDPPYHVEAESDSASEQGEEDPVDSPPRPAVLSIAQLMELLSHSRVDDRSKWKVLEAEYELYKDRKLTRADFLNRVVRVVGMRRINAAVRSWNDPHRMRKKDRPRNKVYQGTFTPGILKYVSAFTDDDEANLTLLYNPKILSGWKFVLKDTRHMRIRYYAYIDWRSGDKSRSTSHVYNSRMYTTARNAALDAIHFLKTSVERH
jgi:hypothetical protein